MTDRCHLLREDADLCRAIPAAEQERAIAYCVAPVLSIRRGRWNGDQMKVMSEGIGLLVLDGLLIRRVGIDGRFGAELLAAGDLLRPWQGEDIYAALPHTTGWRVIERARLAVLDGEVAARLAKYPSLTGAIAARALNRSRRLALMMAIIHHPRIETRLHMLLWHLADRWGRVRPEGVALSLRLSHSVLADLVAAQRPSVSASLKRLSDRGLVAPLDGGWLLCGDPPSELLELQDVEIAQPGRGGGQMHSAVAAG
ncbi:MAG TPA: Crp/Fnr family transcriptional regulator [Solirubrobacteraceae bacterium]|nr:Crp/Fnr family transcriptional regulator [Solirubrobacteraceae bacterium]